MRLLPLLLLVLPACPGPTDKDTGEPETLPALADAGAIVHGESGDLAGSALADAGDRDGDGVPELVVGALGARVACVLEGPVGTADLQLHAARTCLTQEEDYDFLGQAVAGGADVDGDGVPEILVGAPGSDAGLADAGKVWLLGALDAGEIPVADAGARAWTGAVAGDAAGSAVAFAGDLDGDGTEDVLGGAPGSDLGGAQGGATYLVSGVATDGSLADAWAVFVGGTAAEDTPPAKHATTVLGDGVGNAVCRAGDLDGDGLDDLAFGAPGWDGGGDNAGAVAIFYGPIATGTWAVTDADTTLTSDRVGGYAGGALACGSDTDGDGRTELLIGADADGGGRAYLWREGTLADAALVVTGEGTDQLGYSLAFLGDGIAVGSPGADVPAVDAGNVAWFAGPLPTGTVDVADADARWGGDAAGDLAATALTGLADVDGAGTPGLAAGAPYNADPAPIGGAVYVWGVE